MPCASAAWRMLFPSGQLTFFPLIFRVIVSKRLAPHLQAFKSTFLQYAICVEEACETEEEYSFAGLIFTSGALQKVAIQGLSIFFYIYGFYSLCQYENPWRPVKQQLTHLETPLYFWLRCTFNHMALLCSISHAWQEDKMTFLSCAISHLTWYYLF